MPGAGGDVSDRGAIVAQGGGLFPGQQAVTSGRKVRAHSALGLLRVGAQLALRRRAALDYWYGPRVGIATKAPNQAKDDSPSSS